MAALNSKKNTSSKNAKSVSELIVKRSKRRVKAAPMLTEDVVPAGTYHSEVIAVADAQSDTEKLMADVTYRFTNDRGKSVDARVRYPSTGYHIERLFDALIEAGLPEESPLTEAVGIAEEVEIVYPFEGSLGKIKDRRPATTDKKHVPKLQQAKKPVAHPLDEDEEPVDEEDEEDDEFDDFLEDD